MPTLSTLAVFAVAAIGLLLIPGPNVIFIATRSASHGRAAGIASALGVELGTLVHVALATVGLSALIASSEVAFEVVRYLGAAYLVALGVRALRDRAAAGGPATTVVAVSHRRLVRDAMLVNLLNPKVILFFLAFLPQFVDRGRGSVALQTLTLGLVLAALGLLNDVLYATLAAGVARRLRGRRASRDRGRWLTGGIYLGLGALAAAGGPPR